LRQDENSAVFLDTTFLLPFLQIEVDIEAFSLDNFREFLTKIPEVHFSELSVFESKAKLYRLSRKNAVYMQALKNFGINLATLREDEKIVFHPYDERDDVYFNLISSKNFGLDSFDIIIMAQALDVGVLITEDKEILRAREDKAFTDDSILGKMKIKRWRELRL